jgi:hypothetical protein
MVLHQPFPGTLIAPGRVPNRTEKGPAKNPTSAVESAPLRFPRVPRVPVWGRTHLTPTVLGGRLTRNLLSARGKWRVTSEKARVTFCNTACAIKALRMESLPSSAQRE